MKYALDYKSGTKYIGGWVSRKDENQSEENVVILLRGLKGEIARVKCDVQRNDVKDAQLHDTGLCGFKFPSELVDTLIDGNFYSIHIITPKELVRIPILYGDVDILMDKFYRFELPRDDFTILESTPANLFSSGSDIINFKKLIIRLRRGKRAKCSRGKFEGIDYPHKEIDWTIFRLIVISNLKILFKHFNTRYLWSIIDTFVDHGDKYEKLAGLAISNWLYQERFAQTLKCVYDFNEKSNPILNRQLGYWGGMLSNLLNDDDAFDVFITKNIECLEIVPVIKCFYVELLFRSIAEDQSIIGFNFRNSAHFTKMGEYYKNLLNYYSVSSEVIRQSEDKLKKLVTPKKKNL
ncbi:MAG: hypothetical protein WAW36_08645 [Methylovulum miyakonense]|uniref:hypothetical protein n=1 Tax=Methylovulum miyakonense TaxID=645578 RepID=UPI003BB5AF9D